MAEHEETVTTADVEATEAPDVQAAKAADTTSSDVDSTKKAIVDLATANQCKIDNFKEVRPQLDPLFDIMAKSSTLTPAEFLERKQGLWKQLWTDDADDVKANNKVMGTDRARTYQLVYGDGTFYNFNEVVLPFGIRMSAFLSCYYKQADKGLNIGFDGLYLKLGGLGEESGMKALIDNIKAGKQGGLINMTSVSKFPKGPIGATGYNESIYIDEEIRLDRAYNDADKDIDLYVLKRLP
jgi:hypothetical protein|eukprot:CAMPEP_0174285512 /NCGR_PEP_ID=MMETSP0809-20121228/8913_1 /TAXON_ID=73025 ORGANISM="Eutreptiella gymnastica-like, Strain CCMP1594" /NCGR_SAMPLE_ID=MMETSP0809 /ASSEMBLY_ACC=CAM_ASM_000658 /LENGTH=238 /DNA_ID=CAMNT_0015381311 /DNA_START=44 /DNA_END=760 /DNA_ORIENTATION=+